MKAGGRIFGMILAVAVSGIVAGAFAQSAHAPAAAPDTRRDASWARSFAAPGAPSANGGDIGDENRLVNDPRFELLLKASFPQKQWIWFERGKLLSLPDMVQFFLGVPGDALLDENRYVTLDGCVPHDCDDRGMLWMDTGNERALLIFAGTGMVRSNDGSSQTHLWIYTSEKLNWQHMPTSFLASLHRWLATIGADTYRGTSGYRYTFTLVTVVGPNGIMEDIGPDVFGLGQQKQQPTPGAGK
jgi:hypothetical protein